MIDHSDFNFEGKWCCDQSLGCGLCLKRWSFMEIFKLNSLFLNLKNNSTVPNEANLMVSSESCVLPMPYRAMSVRLEEAAPVFVANWLYHLLARLGPSEVGGLLVSPAGCWVLAVAAGGKG